MDNLLKELNPEQKKVVTTTQGPILIIAGAGTGKTRVITYKIAYLIKTKKVNPANILALTFSKKAAGEMLGRVENIIGEHKDEIWISTFHSFCNFVLKDHAQDIGLSPAFKLLDRIKQWIFFRQIMAEFKLDYYLNTSDPTACIDGFLRFIGRAKDELVGPGQYKKFAHAIENEEERNRSLEVAGVYEVYQRRLEENNLLDFGDLISKTYELFLKRKNVLEFYRDRFGYILVDEFQDTNIAQIELVCLLADKYKNICAVGDDDQGIYRFRGASYASFVKFQEKFPQLESMRLTQNYRSTKKVLSVAERIIKKNDIDRFDPQKNLWTKNPSGTKVEIIMTDDYEKEAKIIADKINEIIASAPEEKRDFAVLYRAHSHKDILVSLLKSQKIPFNLRGGIGLFETEEIKDLISFLKIINDPKDSVSLFRVLSSGPFDIDIGELVKMARTAKEKEIPLYDTVENQDNLKKNKGLKKFKNMLDELSAVSFKSGIGELMYRLEEKTGILKTLIKTDMNKAMNLIRFRKFIQKYIEDYNDDSLSLFINYLDAFIEAGGELEIEEDSSLNQGIHLMTIHQAKGLEFDYVFVMGLVQNRFPTRTRKEAVPFPKELIKEKLPAGDYHTQEERRLFYVAITRAKKRLILTAVRKSMQRPSLFLNEVYDGSRQKDAKKTESLIEDELASLFIQKPSLNLPWPDTKLPIPDTFSYSQIDTYRTCPLKYQFSYVYSIPIRPTIALQLGTDMHKIMEEFYRMVKEGKIPTLEEFYQIFLNHYNLPVSLDKKKKDFECLKRYYEIHSENLRPPLYLEEEFLLRVGDANIKGRIDRIDELPDGTVEIIDYKTGKLRKQDFADENIQLDIYALACRKFLKLEPSVLSFYFLLSNQKVTTARNTEDLHAREEKINSVVKKIKNREFQPTPGYCCKWCDYKIICPTYTK